MNKATNDHFTLGLIQMRCDPDPARNMERAIRAHSRRRPRAAPTSSACPNCS